MASYTISPIWGAGAQLFDNSGRPLSGGKIYTYQAGTTTPAVTYTTPTGSTANSNPIIANSAGRLTNEIWFPVSGAYKFVLKDANDVLLATYDNIPTTPQPPIVNDASSISYQQGYEVNAGNFTIGATYLITSVGTTDFVAIGASANQVGILFTATGVGSGTGAAKYSRTVQSKLQETVSVKDFGAVGDGVTDDTAAIQAAVTAKVPLFWPSGTYICKSTIDFVTDSCMIWNGDGSSETIIKFDNAALNYGISRINVQSTNWYFTGLTIEGPGKTVGSFTGIYSYYGTNSLSYNLRFVDVSVINCSVDGIGLYDWFQTYFSGVFCRSIGENGLTIAGDQFPTYINAGSYFTDIDQWCIWFQSGAPFIQGFNAGNVASGIKFGRPSSHPAGTSYVRANIQGVNIEYVKQNGTGLKFENGSDWTYMSNVVIYPDSSVGASPTYNGIYIVYLNNTCFVNGQINFELSQGGSFVNKIQIDGASSSGAIISLQPITSYVNTARQYLVCEITNNNGYFAPSLPIKNGGIWNSKKQLQNTTTYTASTSVKRDSGPQDDFIILMDATSGVLDVLLDYPSYLPNRNVIVKKIDSSANAVTIRATAGTTIDGASTYVLASQYKYVNLISDGISWLVIGNN